MPAAGWAASAGWPGPGDVMISPALAARWPNGVWSCPPPHESECSSPREIILRLRLIRQSRRWRAGAVVRPAGAGRPLTVELMHTGLRSRPVHPRLVRWRWEAAGIDYVPAAIEASAKRRGVAGLSYIVGDVTRLPPAPRAAAELMDAPLGGSFRYARGLDLGRDLHCGSNGQPRAEASTAEHHRAKYALSAPPAKRASHRLATHGKHLKPELTTMVTWYLSLSTTRGGCARSASGRAWRRLAWSGGGHGKRLWVKAKRIWSIAATRRSRRL